MVSLGEEAEICFLAGPVQSVSDIHGVAGELAGLRRVGAYCSLPLCYQQTEMSTQWRPVYKWRSNSACSWGRLGRSRECFLVHPDDCHLKLPSDLLSVERAKHPRGLRLPMCTGQSVFPNRCRHPRACDGIGRMPPPIANDGDVEAARRESQRLSHGMCGFWWERIHLGQEVDALSFFTVEPDDLLYWVRQTHGKGRSPAMLQVAEWNKRLTVGAELEVTYVRKCCRFDVKSLGWRPGLAARPTEHHKKGSGSFWET